MSDVQTMPEDTADNQASAEMANGQAQAASSEAAKFNAHEWQTIHQLRSFVPEDGEWNAEIPFVKLPMSLMIKFLPGSAFDLVGRGVVATNVDTATGVITSFHMTLPLKTKAEKVAKEPKAKVAKVAKEKEIDKTPKDPADILNNAAWVIHVVAENNPWPENSSHYHNFTLYREGETVGQYINFTNYDRALRDQSGAWFNGPKMSYFHTDWAKGNITLTNPTTGETMKQEEWKAKETAVLQKRLDDKKRRAEAAEKKSEEVAAEDKGNEGSYESEKEVVA